MNLIKSHILVFLTCRKHLIQHPVYHIHLFTFFIQILTNHLFCNVNRQYRNLTANITNGLLFFLLYLFSHLIQFFLGDDFRLLTRICYNFFALSHGFSYNTSLFFIGSSYQSLSFLFQLGKFLIGFLGHLHRMVNVSFPFFHHLNNDRETIFGKYHEYHQER